MGRITAETVIEAVNDIPALPQVAVRVMELTGHPDSTAQDISNELMKDQSITARVLRWANSAFYGFPRRIGTVTDAVVLLGFRTIRSIVLAAAVNDVLDRRIEGYALEQGELWQHSQSSAMAARVLETKFNYAYLDLAYTGCSSA